MLWIEEKTKIIASTATHLLCPSATCLWGAAVRSKPFISTSKQRSRQGPPKQNPLTPLLLRTPLLPSHSSSKWPQLIITSLCSRCGERPS